MSLALAGAGVRRTPAPQKMKRLTWFIPAVLKSPIRIRRTGTPIGKSSIPESTAPRLYIIDFKRELAVAFG